MYMYVSGYVHASKWGRDGMFGKYLGREESGFTTWQYSSVMSISCVMQ